MVPAVLQTLSDLFYKRSVRPLSDLFKDLSATRRSTCSTTVVGAVLHALRPLSELFYDRCRQNTNEIALRPLSHQFYECTPVVRAILQLTKSTTVAGDPDVVPAVQPPEWEGDVRNSCQRICTRYTQGLSDSTKHFRAPIQREGRTVNRTNGKVNAGENLTNEQANNT